MEFVGYQNGGAAFAVAWRDNVFGGAVWARRYLVASGTFASSVVLEASEGEVAVATNWVRRMGFDPYCELSPSGCGMAIWQVSNGEGWALHWRQITSGGVFGPIREQVGFRGSGEVGCRGHIEALECTRLLAYIERDDRPEHPDRLWIAKLDATGSVIPSSRLSIYEVVKPVRLFQTAVVYSSAEQRFLVAWAESRGSASELPRTNGAVRFRFVDFHGALMGSRPMLVRYCENEGVGELCGFTKKNDTCGCKGMFVTANSLSGAGLGDRFRITQYSWNARIEADGTAHWMDKDLCSTYCPAAPASFFSGEKAIGYLEMGQSSGDNAGAYYRVPVAGYDPPEFVGFFSRMGDINFRGQGARAALAVEDGYLVRRSVVAGISQAVSSSTGQNTLYLTLFNNGGGCP